MSWLTTLFHYFKNREPTVNQYGNDLGPHPHRGGVRIVEEDDGSMSLVRDGRRLYDSEISRACIHRIASECSKTTPHPVLPNARIDHIVAKCPNPYQTTAQFIEQAVTIALADNNCFIVPILDAFDQVTGLWAVSPTHANWVDINNHIYLDYTLDDGTRAVIEHEKVGQLRRMVYDRALVGEDNSPYLGGAKLYDTNTERSIKLLEANRDPIRWKAKVNHTLVSDDSFAKIESFLADSNATARKTGVLVSDQRFESFEPFTRPVAVMKPEDVQEMRKSAYIYWGVSENILMNAYTEDDWNGFYQSAIEPLLVQLGQVLTRIFYSESQIKRGNGIAIDSDRLQYASIKSRINVAFGTFDRGMASMNTALNILNLDPIDGPDGDDRYIRGEYISTDERRTDDRERNDYAQSDNETADTDRPDEET